MKLSSLLILFLALLVHPEAKAIYFRNTCEHFLLHERGTYETWHVVTDRKSDAIYQALEVGNDPEVLTGRRGPLPAYDAKVVTDGKKSILSLGEGVSSFIFDILRSQSENHHPLNAWAVDMVYTDSHRFFEKSMISKFDLGKIKKMQEEFPGHFVGGYFQKMRFWSPDGSRQLFDEIISSHSVGYLLTKYNHFPDDKFLDVRNKDKELLKSLVRHLKRGGVLRLWPFFPADHRPIDRHIYIQDILDELLADGFISNHNQVFEESPAPSLEEFNKANFLVIQR